MNLKQHKHWFQTFLTIIILTLLAGIVYLYASGYRLTRDDNNPIDFKRTGMINTRSMPDGANVYINGVFTTATNDNVPALDPGVYNLKIVKNGFYTWEKDVEVFAELVTDITAVLVTQSPRFEPLTTTGARVPVISPSLTKLAYFSKDPKESGIAILPLAHTGGIGLFRSDSYVAIEDTFANTFSTGNSIEWSPDEEKLLVQDAKDVYYVVDLLAQSAETTAAPDLLRATWEKELLEIREDFVGRLDLPEDISEIALGRESTWAPDQKKFFYSRPSADDANIIEYRVYNLEKPLPVGEKVDNLVFTTNVNDPRPALTWYADSFHLVMVENYNEEAKSGDISLIRIDGTNKVKVFGATMHSENVYSSPGGEKLIFLTSFSPANQTDLYTVSIR